MSAPGLKSRTTEALAALQAGWAWWREAIVALFPERLRAALTDASIISIDLEDHVILLSQFEDGEVGEIARLPRENFNAASLRAALAAYLLRPWYFRKSFALRLPDGIALKRNMALPLAARRNIANLLEMELDRQSPLDRSEIYHDYRVLRTDRTARRIDVVWRIVRRSSVAPAIEICRKAGIDLAVIAFVGDEALPDGGTLPVATRAAQLLRLRRLLVRGLLLVIVALLFAVMTGAYARNQEASDALAARANDARIAARPSLELAHEITAARKRALLLLHERQHLSVTRILAETTRRLPNGSWLTGFTYRDGEVRIQGMSNAASSLIAAFDASPLFAGTEFRAPLVQAQGPGLEQFDLAFKIRGGVR